MTDYTLMEYAEQGRSPEQKRTACSFGQAYQLQPTTRYFTAIPLANLYLRVSTDGAAATSSDYCLKTTDPHGGASGDRVTPGAYVYAIAAS